MIIFINLFGDSKKKEKLKRMQEKKEEEETKSLFKDALKLLNLKEYKAARDELTNALQVYSKKEGELYFHMLYNLALSYFYEQDYNSAIGYFDKCIGIDVADEHKSNAFLYKGVSLVKRGRMSDRLRKEALGYFNSVVQQDNNDVDAWYLKGCMEFELGDVKSSIGSFDKVIGLDHEYENVYDINLFYEVKRDKIGKKEQKPDKECNHEIVIDKPGDEHDVKTENLRTQAGLVVDSEVEKRTADFLSGQGIEFQYKPTVSWANSHSFSTSFYLPKYNLYMEHFNTTDNSVEIEMDRKVALFQDNRKRFIFTTVDDEAKIETVLKREITKLGRKGSNKRASKLCAQKKTINKKNKKR